jgi:hypothetical protein
MITDEEMEASSASITSLSFTGNGVAKPPLTWILALNIDLDRTVFLPR